MAHTHLQYLADTRYRTTVKYIGDGVTNAAVDLLDVSILQGFQTGGIVNIAKIYWATSAPSGGFDILWKATSNVTAFILEGTSGTYGYQPGQPALVMPRVAVGSQPPGTPSGALPSGFTGDVLITNASATYTIVIEYHKIESTIGAGNGWGA